MTLPAVIICPQPSANLTMHTLIYRLLRDSTPLKLRLGHTTHKRKAHHSRVSPHHSTSETPTAVLTPHALYPAVPTHAVPQTFLHTAS